MFEEPPLPNYLNPRPQSGVYGLQTQTHGPVQRMLYPTQTQNTPPGYGTPTIPLTTYATGHNQSPYLTYPTTMSYKTPHHPTWSGEPWTYQGPTPGHYTLVSQFKQAAYHSPPNKSLAPTEHQTSGLPRTPTPVLTRATPPESDNDNKVTVTCSLTPTCPADEPKDSCRQKTQDLQRRV